MRLHRVVSTYAKLWAGFSRRRVFGRRGSWLFVPRHTHTHTVVATPAQAPWCGVFTRARRHKHRRYLAVRRALTCVVLLRSYTIPSRFRRFLVARAKRLAANDSGASGLVWVALGRRCFVYRKGQNARMGKGVGSLYSSRRCFAAGSEVLLWAGWAPRVANSLVKYVRARLAGYT